MEFLQSKAGKIFFIAFLIMVVLTIGAMKIGGSSATPPTTATEQAPEQAETSTNPEEATAQQSQEGAPQAESGNAATAFSNSDAYRNGKKSEQEGDLRSALKYYNIASNSEDVKTKSAALSALAGIYMQYNDSKMIIETLEKQLEIETDKDARMGAYESLASTYKYLDAYDKAIEMYKESYKVKKTPNAVLRLCELYEKLHDDNSIREQIYDYVGEYPQHFGMFQKYKAYLDQPVQEPEQKEFNPEQQEYTNPPENPEDSATQTENNQQ